MVVEDTVRRPADEAVHQAVSAALAGTGGRAKVTITPLGPCGLGIAVVPLDAASALNQTQLAARAEPGAAGPVYQAVRALVESCGADRAALIVIDPEGAVEARSAPLA